MLEAKLDRMAVIEVSLTRPEMEIEFGRKRCASCGAVRSPRLQRACRIAFQTLESEEGRAT